MRPSPSHICPILTLFANLALVPLVLFLFLPRVGSAQEEYSFDLEYASMGAFADAADAAHAAVRDR